MDFDANLSEDDRDLLAEALRMIVRERLARPSGTIRVKDLAEFLGQVLALARKLEVDLEDLP